MNNAKIWLVVPPKLGVPVFLSAVAVGSFATHVAVVSNTSWVSDFISGQELGSGDASATLLRQQAPETAKASYAMPVAGGQEITVILPDGTTAKAILQTNEVHAALKPDRRLFTD